MTIQAQPSQSSPQSLVTIMIDVMILVVMAVWVFSIIRKAVRGEEVEAPLSLLQRRQELTLK